MSLATIKKMRELRYGTIGKVEWVIKALDKISAVIYTSDTHECYTATAYTRNSLHPKFNYRFKTRDRRDEYATAWFSNQIKREESKAAERKERNKGHTLQVGAVLNTSWGYDQTNVDYYQLVELKGKSTAMFREIAQIEHDDSHVLPAVDSFVGEVFSKRVNAKYNSIKISSCQTATPVNKDEQGNYTPSYKTPWGMGH